MLALAADAGEHGRAPHDHRDTTQVDPRVRVPFGVERVDHGQGQERDKTRHPEQRGRVLRRRGGGRGGQRGGSSVFDADQNVNQTSERHRSAQNAEKHQLSHKVPSVCRRADTDRGPMR